MKTTLSKIIAGGLIIATGLTILPRPLGADALSLTQWFKGKSTKTKLPRADMSVKRFKSEAELKEYIRQAQAQGNSGYGIGRNMMALKAETSAMAPTAAQDSAGPTRFSETNVQVVGIDEPDVVKTDGKELYYSSWQNYYRPMLMMEKIAPGEPYPNYEPRGETKIVKAFPVDSLKKEGKIDKNGDLLLSGNILMVFAYDKIYGYDVTDKNNPKEKWSLEFGKNNTLAGARLYNGKLYFATREYLNVSNPCPLKSLVKSNGQSITIPCTSIYHPVVNVNADTMFNVFVADPASGDVKDKTAFVGSSSDSVLYMSNGSIYLTYFYAGDTLKYNYNFFLENKDIVPGWLIDKLSRLQTYDISQGAKMAEYEYLVNRWQSDLNSDDQLKVRNELQNRQEKFYESHKRELEQTGVAKISLANFRVTGVGTVPGRLLNQYSLDEYKNNLRVATTIGEGWWGIGMWGGARKTTNDVYVLNDSMNTVGSVKDLGKEERIYSVRFMGDRGYLVTFKQIDPFFVLDLADARNPKVAGELKIPGYSSYLHMVDNSTVLGLGQEGGKVKVSLFDVKNASNPTEISKYILDEYWSEALNNPHAFLMDAKHQIFFMPGSSGGYIFSYKNNTLSLTKAIGGIQAQRALYINDNLYIVGQDKLVIVDEQTGERVKELSWN